MQIKNLFKKLARKYKITRKIYIKYNMYMDNGLQGLIIKKNVKRNYVFMVPTHNNAGDVAQTVCIKNWLEENYKGYLNILVSLTAPKDELALKEICNNVRLDDNVFIHSGFNMTDISDEFAAPTVFASHKIVIDSLPNNKIVFFPQTVQYRSLDKWKKIQDIYSRHKNIVFISRDKISYEYAKKLIPNAKHLCYPDIVTSWIGKFNFETSQTGILVCVRYGDESLLSEEERKIIINKLGKIANVDRTDTDFNKNGRYLRRHRNTVVYDKIKEFSKYKVIVTDRYHGIIFALIAGKPVVVLRTSGHKVTSGLSWFPEEFSKYVYYVSDVSDMAEIENKVKEAYERSEREKLPMYFRNVYFNGLKKEI